MKYRLLYEIFDGYRINSHGISESRTNTCSDIIIADFDEEAKKEAKKATEQLKKSGNFNRIVSFERIDQEEKTTRLDIND